MTVIDIMSQLAELEALDLSQDLLGGPNVRIRSGATVRHTSDGHTCFVKTPVDAARIMRTTIADQKGMLVLRGQIGVRGEIIGLIGKDDKENALPCYTMPAFASWREWVHLVNFEFMNPNPDATEALKDLTMQGKFVPWESRGTNSDAGGETPWVPIQEKLYDRESPGKNLPERWENGLVLDSFVLVPADPRIGPNLTEYVDAASGNTKQVSDFTSFLDTLVPNIAAAHKAAALVEGLRGPERAEAVKVRQRAFQHLSTLTGYGEEWPFRPTLGYANVKGHETELNFFGDRKPKSEPTPATEGETETTEPQTSDEAFDTSE